MELNEVGFKFVRKCINAVETKGEELTWPGRASHGLELGCSSCSTVLVTNTGLQLRAEECVFFSYMRVLREQKSHVVGNVVTSRLGLYFHLYADFAHGFLSFGPEHTHCWAAGEQLRQQDRGWLQAPSASVCGAAEAGGGVASHPLGCPYCPACTSEHPVNITSVRRGPGFTSRFLGLWQPRPAGAQRPCSQSQERQWLCLSQHWPVFSDSLSMCLSSVRG